MTENGGFAEKGWICTTASAEIRGNSHMLCYFLLKKAGFVRQQARNNSEVCRQSTALPATTTGASDLNFQQKIAQHMRIAPDFLVVSIES